MKVGSIWSANTLELTSKNMLRKRSVFTCKATKLSFSVFIRVCLHIIRNRIAKMSAIDRAQELLAMNPLPPDVEQRLEALEAEATADEKPLFASLWEALFTAQNS